MKERISLINNFVFRCMPIVKNTSIFLTVLDDVHVILMGNEIWLMIKPIISYSSAILVIIANKVPHMS